MNILCVLYFLFAFFKTKKIVNPVYPYLRLSTTLTLNKGKSTIYT